MSLEMQEEIMQELRQATHAMRKLVQAIEKQSESVTALIECNTKLMTALIDLQVPENIDDDEIQYDLSGRPIAR